MPDESNKLEIWFEKGLQFHKLKPDDIVATKALSESFTCYKVGLTFFAAVVSLVFLLRTHAKLEPGEFVGLPILVLVPLANTAFFSTIFYALLRLFAIRVSLREVTSICCFALGGLLPFSSVGAGYFLYSAIQLALSYRDPGLPYLKAAVYQLLVSEPEITSLRVLMWSLMLLLIMLTVFYMANMVKLTAKLAECSRSRYVVICIIASWFIDLVVVRSCFSFVFWKLIIQVGAHSG